MRQNQSPVRVCLTLNNSGVSAELILHAAGLIYLHMYSKKPGYACWSQQSGPTWRATLTLPLTTAIIRGVKPVLGSLYSSRSDTLIPAADVVRSTLPGTGCELVGAWYASDHRTRCARTCEVAEALVEELLDKRY